MNSARGRRHPAKLMAEARRMRVLGYGTPDIIQAFKLDGHTVHPDTVRRWVNPEAEAADRRQQAEANARRSAAKGARPQGRPNATREFKAARVRALHDQAHLTVGAIANVMRFDYGDDIATTDVQAILRGDEYPR